MAIRAMIAPLETPSFMLVARRLRLPSFWRSLIPNATGMSRSRPIRAHLAISSVRSGRDRRRDRLGTVEASIGVANHLTAAHPLSRVRGERLVSGGSGRGLDRLVEHELAALGDVRAVGGQGRVAVLVDGVRTE